MQSGNDESPIKTESIDDMRRPVMKRHLWDARWQYSKIAVISGVVSVLVGSFIIATGMALFRGSSLTQPSDVAIVWLLFVIYSGILIMPISIIAGIPLMLFLKDVPGAIWLLTCVYVALVSALIGSSVTFPDSFPGSAAYTVPYALIYGLCAIGIRNRITGNHTMS